MPLPLLAEASGGIPGPKCSKEDCNLDGESEARSLWRAVPAPEKGGTQGKSFKISKFHVSHAQNRRNSNCSPHGAVLRCLHKR